MSVYARFLLLFFAILLLAPAGYASAREIEFRPLTLFLSDDPAVLGIGGVDMTARDSSPDIHHPAGLAQRQGRLSFQHSLENVFRPDDGARKGTRIGTSASEASALFPFEAPYLKKSALAFKFNKFEFETDVPTGSVAVPFKTAQKFEAGSIAVCSSPFPYLRVGLGREETRGRASIFYELALTPRDGISANYRRYRRDLRLDTFIKHDGHIASFTVSPFSEDARELSVNVSVPEELDAGLAFENSLPENVSFHVRIYPGNVTTIGYSRDKLQSDFQSDISVDGAPGGHVGGSVRYASDKLEFAVRTSTRRYIAGLKGTALDIEGAGAVSGNSVLGFWENLLAGDRFLDYGFAARSEQFYAGVEDKATDRLTLRGGLQYIVARLDGVFDHWTPFPIVKIGKLDEQVANPQISKAILGAFTLGANYRLGRMELSYGFGQLIPIRTETRPKEPGAEAKGAGGAGGRFSGKEIWDKIKRNPGGNIQSMRLTWYF